VFAFVRGELGLGGFTLFAVVPLAGWTVLEIFSLDAHAHFDGMRFAFWCLSVLGWFLFVHFGFLFFDCFGGDIWGVN
jgi:hypothetical protein